MPPNLILYRIILIIFGVLVTGLLPIWAQKKDPQQPPIKSSADTQNADSEAHKSASTRQIIPPQLLTQVEAIYPPKALKEGQEGSVLLLATINVDGRVCEVEIQESGGAIFDQAAIHAVEQWTFKPAIQNQKPLEVRVPIPFEFSVPVPMPTSKEIESSSSHRHVHAHSKSHSKAHSRAHNHEEPQVQSPLQTDQRSHPPLPIHSEDDEPIEMEIVGHHGQRTEVRSGGDIEVKRDTLLLIPRQEGADVLKSTPGLYIGRSAGPAVAHRYMLRGFDADHGQDLSFMVGGLPINLPSHIHGQGYADLGFLISDVVNTMHISEGVYDPSQGDFSVAGSIDLDLGVPSEDRGVYLSMGMGNWNSTRFKGVWAPKEGYEGDFGAVQYQSSDGFGQNRASDIGSVLIQKEWGTHRSKWRFISLLHTAQSKSAGLVRHEDWRSGKLCFLCTYDSPTALGQSGFNQRMMMGMFYHFSGVGDANGDLGAWVGFDRFRLKQNLTGFMERSQVLSGVMGKGDLISQLNDTDSLGIQGRYRLDRWTWAEKVYSTFEIGCQGRFDRITQQQDLVDASTRFQIWDQRVDASIQGVDIGFWGDLETFFTRKLRVRAGMRGNLLSYDIQDKLGNFTPATRPENRYIQGFNRTASGLAVGPRASASYRLSPHLKLFGAFGRGYRSPQARTLEEGERAPYTLVDSGDVALKFKLIDLLQSTIGVYVTEVSDDVAFDAREGRLERIGRTLRQGMYGYLEWRPTSWLVNSLSLTYVNTQMKEPPLPTAQDPQPPFEQDQSLPLIAPFVGRWDFGLLKPLGEWGGLRSRLRAGIGFSYLSGRPLPYGGTSEPVSLLDGSIGLDWGAFELNFELFNLLDLQYGATELSYVSHWDPNEASRSRTPARHYAAGGPRTWMISFGVRR
jgi:iron complex outermembrane recepter protein